MKKGVKKWLARIALVILGPLVALLLIELVWQLIGDPRIAKNEAWLKTRPKHFELGRLGFLSTDEDPEVSFRLTPGFTATVEGDKYRINEHGMRGAPVPLEKPEGIERVLILGDSYAFGFGVDEPDTIAAQLAKRLADKHPDTEVLNLGVPGYQTGQALAVLTRDGLRFEPDLVVLVYYANDNITQTFLYDPRLRVAYVDELPLPMGLKRFLARSIVYAKITEGYTQWLKSSGELDSRGERHWPTTRGRLQGIAALCKQHRIGFVLVAIPALDNSTAFIDKEHMYNRDHDRLLAFAAAEGIPVADLRAVLLERGKPIEYLFVSREPPDSHLNREGYAILVEALVQRIEGDGLLGR